MGFAYKIVNQQAPHFITATVVQWIDVFTRQLYTDILLDSLRFCQNKKGLDIYGWVVMSNHIHMIAAAREGFQLSDILRDFKKFTSTAIVDAIQQNPRESRKNWLLWLLRQNNETQFWQEGNHPEEIRTQEFFQQKLNYIHANPVRAGIVDKEDEYKYSSARNFYGSKGLLLLADYY